MPSSCLRTGAHPRPHLQCVDKYCHVLLASLSLYPRNTRWLIMHSTRKENLSLDYVTENTKWILARLSLFRYRLLEQTNQANKIAQKLEFCFVWIEKFFFLLFLALCLFIIIFHYYLHYHFHCLCHCHSHYHYY